MILKTDDTRELPVIAITGANGFIGKYLVSVLSEIPDISLRLLVRNPSGSNRFPTNIVQIKGDLTKPETLEKFLVHGCIVINLAYSFDASREINITAINNLISASKKNSIKRVIHCSTAAVYGHVSLDSVDESSQCNPHSSYGKTKLLIEDMFLSESKGNFEYVNVRPTAVYGAEGPALMKLINNLVNGNNVANYLRSCLFNVRTLNLVHVSNVVAAIKFLIDTDKEIDGQTYIISEDFESKNNYKYVETYIRERLTNRRYIVPPLPLPLGLLSWLLRLLRRDSINPKMVYDTEKLKNMGFKYVTSLDSGLDGLCGWYEKKNNTQCSSKI